MEHSTGNNETKHVLIDRLVVPRQAKEKFIDRLNKNRDFIRHLPGFIEDKVYQHIDGRKNPVYITIAVWESQNSLVEAKKAVKAEYKKQGFDPAEFFRRHNISSERGTYTHLN